MRNAVILSSGMHVPERVVSNREFDEMLGENVSAWLEQTAQIFERRWCSESEAASDLAVQAAQQALDRAGVPAAEVDLIILATDTPDFVSPPTASVVQHRLGAARAGIFDLNAACAGFVTGLHLGASYLRAQRRLRHVLVIGTYAMSKFLNLKDKKTVTLFADGAGAVLLGAADTDEDSGYLAGTLSAMGQYHDGMGIYAGGTRFPATPERLEAGEHLLRFVYKFPADLNQREWTRIIRELCAESGHTPEEIQHYVITQINIGSIRATMEALSLPPERACTVMHRYGYTGSACIPMAFHEAVESGRIRRGDLVQFIGSGGGLAFAGAAFRY
ncbi:MAG: ketoacyl-ACP synthase III [Bacteroidia bacterium]|nr:ketoacyl-ACP synthase III [Bacteroidia bacterium]